MPVVGGKAAQREQAALDALGDGREGSARGLRQRRQRGDLARGARRLEPGGPGGGDLADARPDWLEPSSTAREIAALPALPQAARGAFAAIAVRVERSLFALRSLSAEDWHAARAAYADFALAAPR